MCLAIMAWPGGRGFDPATMACDAPTVGVPRNPNPAVAAKNCIVSKDNPADPPRSCPGTRPTAAR